MTRWLAGVIAPGAGSGSLGAVLDPYPATEETIGPLRVAYSGPAGAREGASLCLLDGFIDNAPALASELGVAAAAVEQTLLAGWRRWGTQLASRLRGDFALLVWDGERGILARDHIGARSLFVHEDGGALRFAGEIRHLLALLPSRPAPDQVSVAHWLTMGQRPGQATLYERVRRLGPGSQVVFERGRWHEERYWEPRYAEPYEASPGELVEMAREQLRGAVARRVAPDGRTGVLMSGGLDSTSVAALCAQSAPQTTELYSAVFPGHPQVDESELIDQVRLALGTPATIARVQPGGMIQSAAQAVAEWQLPLRSWGDFWALPLLRAAATAGVRVEMGGDGGDELFGARAYLLADRLRAGHALSAAALVRELPGASSLPPRRELARVFAELAIIGALPHWAHRVTEPITARRGTPPWLLAPARRALLSSDDPWAWKQLQGPRWWAEIAHGLTRRVEEIGVFEHQRRRAASAGLDCRHPLFDLDLVGFCLRMPPLSTFDRERTRPVLRAAMSGLLPDAVRLRPGKARFDAVLIETLSGPDRPAVDALLADPKAEIGAYVDQAKMRDELLDAGRDRRDFAWMWQVWRLATAELWLRYQESGAIDQAVWAAASKPAISLDRARG